MSPPVVAETDPTDPQPRVVNALEGLRVVSGSRVVLAMFVFGLLMTGAMYLYWELYTRPFRPLQHAIAAEFKDSSPQAIGGRHKSHRAGAPAILRLIVRIPWDPRNDETRARAMANRLTEIARQNIDATAYNLLEIRLLHRRPERWSITWSLDAPWPAFPLPPTGALPAGTRTSVLEGVEGT